MYPRYFIRGCMSIKVLILLIDAILTFILAAYGQKSAKHTAKCPNDYIFFCVNPVSPLFLVKWPNVTLLLNLFAPLEFSQR